MEYHSKQPLSHVWLKWQWQEREKKGAVGQNTEHTLSIEVAELQVPKSQLHLPLSSCVCTWLMRGKSNNNLKHYCPTEGFTEKDCLCRAETERLCSQPVNIPHSIFQYTVDEVWTPNSCCQTCIVHYLQDPQTTVCPVRKKSLKPIILNRVSCVVRACLMADTVHREAWTGGLPVGRLY